METASIPPVILKGMQQDESFTLTGIRSKTALTLNLQIQQDSTELIQVVSLQGIKSHKCLCLPFAREERAGRKTHLLARE